MLSPAYGAAHNDDVLYLPPKIPEMQHDRTARLRSMAYPRHRFVYQYGLGDDWHYGSHLKECMQTDHEPYGEA